MYMVSRLLLYKWSTRRETAGKRVEEGQVEMARKMRWAGREVWEHSEMETFKIADLLQAVVLVERRQEGHSNPSAQYHSHWLVA